MADTARAEGNKAWSAGDFDAAIEAYTRAIQINSTDPLLYSNRAAAYTKKSVMPLPPARPPARTHARTYACTPT